MNHTDNLAENGQSDMAENNFGIVSKGLAAANEARRCTIIQSVLSGSSINLTAERAGADILHAERGD